MKAIAAATVALALSLLLVTPITTRAQTPPAASLSPPASMADASADQEYRIQIGDELGIKFFYNSDLNEQVIVRPDGRISLQLIPEIVVANMSPAELTKELTRLYSAELRQPRVTVIVRGFGSQRVFVDGEVGRPGMVPILGLMTALQAIAEAGGMTQTARATEVIVIRRGAPNKPVLFSLDMKKARDGTDMSQDISLAPFDVIYVPRSRIANVNAWVDQYIRKNIPIPFTIQFGIYR